MKRRLGRRINFGTHIAARDRVYFAVIKLPFLERHDIALVEGAEALLRERGG